MKDIPVRLPGKDRFMEEKKETVLTSVEQLNEYLKENGDEKTVISIVLELTGTDIAKSGVSGMEGGAANG